VVFQMFLLVRLVNVQTGGFLSIFNAKSSL
jgi:hypothetical protein